MAKDKKDADPKDTLHILNSREKKPIIKAVKEQWGVDFQPEVMLMTDKKKVYVMSRSMEDIDWQSFRIDKIGLYIGRFDAEKGMRLTIEGSQLIGPEADKNVLEISDEETRLWFKGDDLDIPGQRTKDCEGFMILKNKDDFLGCGKLTERGVLNFVPKARRVSVF